MNLTQAKKAVGKRVRVMGTNPPLVGVLIGFAQRTPERGFAATYAIVEYTKPVDGEDRHTYPPSRLALVKIDKKPIKKTGKVTK